MRDAVNQQVHCLEVTPFIGWLGPVSPATDAIADPPRGAHDGLA